MARKRSGMLEELKVVRMQNRRGRTSGEVGKVARNYEKESVAGHGKEFALYSRLSGKSIKFPGENNFIKRILLTTP